MTKVPHLEGLRGLAALAVVLHHTEMALFGRHSGVLKNSLSSLPSEVQTNLLYLFDGVVHAPLAVVIFFVLSGFVLSVRYFSLRSSSESQSSDYLRSATIRRYPRLALPVLASVMFAYVLLKLGWMQNRELSEWVGWKIWIGAFYDFKPDFWGAVDSALWGTFFDFDMRHSYNGVLWTIEKEFLGSLVVFATLALIGTARIRWILYLLMATVFFSLNLHWLNAFLFGLALCDAAASGFPPLQPDDDSKTAGLLRGWQSSRLASVGAFLLFCWSAGPRDQEKFYLFVIACGVVAATLFFSPWQRLLSAKPFVLLGRFSFGLYLLHLPIICSLGAWSYLTLRPELGHDVAAYLSAVAIVASTLVLSWAFAELIDQPSVRLAKRFA